ncbi:LysE family translocator [uncultured Sphaerochaeta sp.]|uniref:LysE family translocator n=1 Tax=uncultured Sphaerochaeta sp. TaxID=886478 RepID=UPI002A0A9624|nr:LysE family translocator [uncultured Sphaerochaeta sp.]
MEQHFWLGFLITAFFMNIAPGPDMIYLVSQTMAYGKKVGFASILGLGAGAFIHTTFVALGISAILTTSVVVFKTIKLIGAGYLLYLGFRSLFFGGKPIFSKTQSSSEPKSFRKAFLSAVLIDVTNPKVALFFIAILPQFYRENSIPKTAQFLVLGLVIILVGFLVEGVTVLLADTFTTALRTKPIYAQILDKAFGCVLIALGAKLLLNRDTQ